MSDTLDYVIKNPLTVAELIKKLQALPSEFKDAEVWVGENDKDGNGHAQPLNGMELMDESEQDGEVYKESITLLANDYKFID